MDKALKTFHRVKKVFVSEGIRSHFNFPKLHMLSHYVQLIKSRGSPDGYNTELPERLHIEYAKKGY